jgi:hypothetical protein
MYARYLCLLIRVCSRPGWFSRNVFVLNASSVRTDDRYSYVEQCVPSTQVKFWFSCSLRINNHIGTVSFHLMCTSLQSVWKCERSLKEYIQEYLALKLILSLLETFCVPSLEYWCQCLLELILSLVETFYVTSLTADTQNRCDTWCTSWINHQSFAICLKSCVTDRWNSTLGLVWQQSLSKKKVF